MTLCKKQSTKSEQLQKPSGHATTEPSQHSRKNGWSWPPHPLQFVAWTTYIFFTIVAFGVLLPLLPQNWLAAGYICTGALFAFHLVVHLLAVSIDPADDSVRAKNSTGPLPAFDRSKHAHVIENMHCYICEVDVGSKSKHCSICNKCVSSFDHHCKWLNNCVGGKNYWLFFNCLISALLGTFLLTGVSSFVFAAVFINPQLLRSNIYYQDAKNGCDVWYVFPPAAPVETQTPVILVLAGVVSFTGLITIILIGQLLCFHIYLLYNRLSTYDYIMRRRQSEDIKSSERQLEEGSTPPTGRIDMQEISNAEDVSHENSVEKKEDFTSGLQDRGCPILPKDGDNLNGGLGVDHQPSSKVLRKNTKKKKRKSKKSNKVSPDVAQQPSEEEPPRPDLLPPRTNNELPVSPEPPSLCAPHAALPPQPLPVYVPMRMQPVQASGPPAEYHSDSADSMEEIPVAQTHLGSSSMNNMFFSQPSPTNVPNFSHHYEHGQSTYQWTVPQHQQFAVLRDTSPIFVSDTSGDPLPSGPFDLN
ncbi:palmitoyltransferase ZDHHC1 [Spea bombifrons]|uniref:palmitoyltransferase ZDHHC1 n=1 Tax=Spea bombifrons TaxID=233779 RepID=UPI00234961D6|nr:palmitoyltransferase ZDHHC1 [Spea bombifrons]